MIFLSFLHQLTSSFSSLTPSSPTAPLFTPLFLPVSHLLFYLFLSSWVRQQLLSFSLPPPPFFFLSYTCFHYSSLLLLQVWLRSARPLTWTPFSTLPSLHLQHHLHHLTPTPLSSLASLRHPLVRIFVTSSSSSSLTHSLIPLNAVCMPVCPTEKSIMISRR